MNSRPDPSVRSAMSDKIYLTREQWESAVSASTLLEALTVLGAPLKWRVAACVACARPMLEELGRKHPHRAKLEAVLYLTEQWLDDRARLPSRDALAVARSSTRVRMQDRVDDDVACACFAVTTGGAACITLIASAYGNAAAPDFTAESGAAAFAAREAAERRFADVVRNTVTWEQAAQVSNGLQRG